MRVGCSYSSLFVCAFVLLLFYGSYNLKLTSYVMLQYFWFTVGCILFELEFCSNDL